MVKNRAIGKCGRKVRHSSVCFIFCFSLISDPETTERNISIKGPVMPFQDYISVLTGVEMLQTMTSRIRERIQKYTFVVKPRKGVHIWRHLSTRHIDTSVWWPPWPWNATIGPFTRHKITQIRSRSHPDRVKNVRVNGTHKTDPTSMWDQSGSLLHPSKFVGSI
jgi:hypothetical protein